jgi:NADPH:quinone reductase-like Zn-dependent oxidoreductase
MKAIAQTSYGPPEALQLQEKERPSPRDNEVLVKVHAASVNALDWRLFTFPLFVRRVIGGGFRRPKDPSCGADFAGHVEAVGPAVTQFRPGDAVFGAKRGAFAEYVCATEDKMASKPAGVSFEAAAAVPVAALTALQALRDQAHVQSGQTVLVNGAGGGVGTFAVQIAKAFGAEVTAVCSTRNQDVARSIGADHVVDYTREDVTKNGRRYDVIIGANGYHSIFDYRRALNPNGVYVVLGGAMLQMLQALIFGPVLSRVDKRQFRGLMANVNQKDLVVLKELLESGKLVPAIDRRYPLAEIAAAIRYLIGGHASGKVVITVDTGHHPQAAGR